MSEDVFLEGVSRKYPEEILHKRLETEGMVIACLYKDPLLLDESGLEKKHFLSKEGRFYFNLAKFLRKNGLAIFDEPGVLSCLNEEMINRFNHYGGYERIEDMTANVSLDNYETWLDALYREHIICQLHDRHFGMMEEISYCGEKVVPLQLFKNGFTAEDVIDFYESILADMDTGVNTKIIEDESVDLDDAWIDGLGETTQTGCPFNYSFPDMNGKPMECYPMLSNWVMGLLPKSTSVFAGYSSVGKSTWWLGVLAALVFRGHKVLVVSNEESVSKLKEKTMVWLNAQYFKDLDIIKKQVVSGEVKKSMNSVREIQKVFREYFLGNLHYVRITDPDMDLVCKTIRKKVLMDGFDVVLYDTFKMQEADMANSRQDLSLIRDIRRLDRLAVKYGLIMLCSIQLAESMSHRLWLDAGCLSNSKQIKEQLENLFMARNVFEDECDPGSKYYLRPFNRVQDEYGVWLEEEYELDSEKVYKVLFVEKSRNGANSKDTGTALLLEFDGDHSVFREVALCRPRHGTIV